MAAPQQVAMGPLGHSPARLLPAHATHSPVEDIATELAAMQIIAPLEEAVPRPPRPPRERSGLALPSLQLQMVADRLVALSHAQGSLPAILCKAYQATVLCEQADPSDPFAAKVRVLHGPAVSCAPRRVTLARD